jgi:type IV fimbrial biogenesis protein FimT
MKKEHGFTVIELMVTLAIVAIVLTVGVPGVKTLIYNNRVTAATNSLVGSLTYARSEAVKQGVSTSICSSSNQTSCTGSAWSTGWLVWVDLDNDTTLDSPGEIVRVSEALRGTVAVSAANTTISYDATGFTATPGTIKVCDDRTGNTGNQLQLLTGGSVSLTTRVACP